MKKSFLMFAAGLGMLSFASCSNDDAPVANTDGRVTFTVELPADMVTRAAAEPGNGLSATTLHYAVYKHGETTPLIVDAAGPATASYGPAATFSNLETTLTLQLADNVHYDIVFYATSGTPAYEYSYTSQSISFKSGSTANQEGYDAFYATVQNFTTAGGDQNVTLTRPFAQINVGTNDLSNPTVTAPTQSSVTVKAAPTTLNLMTGVATGSQNVEFVASPVLSSTQYSFPVSEYEYVAMAYVLAGGDKDHNPSGTYTVEVKTNGNTETFDWTNVPLRTNYRTNIYGSLFTSNTNFKITIDPFFGDYSTVSTVAWDGTTDTSWYETSATSFSLTTPAQLAGLAKLVNDGNTFEGKTITIDGDFDLSAANWTPIGTLSYSVLDNNEVDLNSITGNAFKGVIDGKGHVIKGLKFNTTTDGVSGFVNALDGANAVVRNIVFTDVDVNSAGENKRGAGVAVGVMLNGATVQNVNVASGFVNGSWATGGVVGRVLKQGTVKWCSNNATITTSKFFTGGIVGAASLGIANKVGITIEECSNTGAITTALGYAGGIVGVSAADVINCSNSATVTGTNASIGGIVGEQDNCGSIVNCTNTANITSDGSSGSFGCGGIVGWIRYHGKVDAYPYKEVIEVSGCTNRGSVISSSADAGGIVGTCYNFGNIHNNFNYAPEIKAYTFAAGIVGNIQVVGVQDTYFPGMEEAARHISVVDNYSSTIADKVSVTSGSCSSAYAYDNTTGSKTTISGNYGVGDANTTPW